MLDKYLYSEPFAAPFYSFANAARRHPLCAALLPAILFLAVLCGCRGSLNQSALPLIHNAPQSAHASLPEAAQASPHATAAATPSDSEMTLDMAIAELDAMQELTPEERAKIVSDLHGTKPSQMRQMMQVYRSAFAFRRQLAEKEKRDQDQPADVTRLVGHEVQQDQSAAVPGSINVSDTKKTASADRHQQQARSHSTDTPATIPSLKPTLKLADNSSGVRQANYQQAEPQPVSSTNNSSPQVHSTLAIANAPAAQKRHWKTYLDLAIADLEQQASSAPQSAEEVRQQATLRMLYLAARKKDAAQSPIPGISATQQDFWKESLFGLASYMDHDQIPDASRRAAEARRHLDLATARLGELSTLTVQNLAFVSEVKSFGAFTRYDNYSFQPGQEVLLYAEVDNFRWEEIEQGYQASLRSSYQILDSRGQRVEDHDFATTEETFQSRRRDYYLRYYVWLPKRIYDGKYTLQLTIEDTKSQKIGQASIDFEIKEPR